MSSETGNGFAITGIVLGAVSLLFLPIIIGPIGIVFAGISKAKKQSLSTVALVISIIGTVAGMVIGAVVGASVFGS